MVDGQPGDSAELAISNSYPTSTSVIIVLLKLKEVPQNRLQSF